MDNLQDRLIRKSKGLNYTQHALSLKNRQDSSRNYYAYACMNTTLQEPLDRAKRLCVKSCLWWGLGDGGPGVGVT